MAENSYNLEALGLEDEVRRDVKKALAFGNVDPAQLEYFKRANKEALSQPPTQLPPPPPPTAIESVEPTAEEEAQQAAERISASTGITPSYISGPSMIGERLWGTPKMRGHIK